MITNESGNLKLPKTEIKKFSGDPKNWMDFIESFDTVIHSNPDLSNIDKMNYLVNLLVGKAKSQLKGFTFRQSTIME